MRILYIDIDSLRPDHLGCYGYHRNTSPTIDALAAQGVRFDNCYVSDAPCLPSRTAMTQGRFGIHTGVVNHGGTAADILPHGRDRGHSGRPSFETWFQCLRRAGFRTASITPFPSRHGAWWFLAGLTEWHDTGKWGHENADEVNAKALPWLEAHASEDNWFLHVNYWDPHTGYSTPVQYGNPFENDPPPAWLTEETRQAHWDSYGTISAQDALGYWVPDQPYERPGIPKSIASMEDWKAWIDGYDIGIRYADDHLRQLLDVLEEKDVLGDTLIVVTADHGENQGELNIYGDHELADGITCRVPFIVRYPGLSQQGKVDDALHYQFDMAATLLELLDIEVPSGWDAKSFADALGAGRTEGRDHLVLSQMTWSCQRSVRFDRWLAIRTYHEGLKNLPQVMLFDVENDPHEQRNLAREHPEIVNAGMAKLEGWHTDMMATSTAAQPVDPMQIVLREGGPYYTWGLIENYLRRLRETGRSHHAAELESRFMQATT